MFHVAEGVLLQAEPLSATSVAKKASEGAMREGVMHLVKPKNPPGDTALVPVQRWALGSPVPNRPTRTTHQWPHPFQVREARDMASLL